MFPRDIHQGSALETVMKDGEMVQEELKTSYRHWFFVCLFVFFKIEKKKKKF